MNFTKVKICDFGIACELPETHGGKKVTEADVLLTDGCGTLCYAAPEVIQASSKFKYGCRADIWSCGVVAYALLSGQPPFESKNQDESKNQKELRRQIKAGKYSLSEDIWSDISGKLIHLTLVKVPPVNNTSTPFCR